ncbi:sensor histidine kinase [Clostridium sp. DJ247]|uniref:sensor histidine kinase n=1 Tax=Clostridium sp. DJ247 TaxID=2726188 RepID=UPI0016263A02|nr:GHKL domain-containing protein [Clostridium sp. DJ247]MBC2581412.1 GHKL domain-containing protein [Clostridium sp. DJ247]
MVGDIKLSILTSIEILSMLLIWNSLGLKGRRKYLKIFMITTLLTSVIVFDNKINLSIAIYVNYVLFIIMIMYFFKKNIMETFVEFCIVTITCMSIELILIGFLKYFHIKSNNNSFIIDVLGAIILLGISICLSRWTTIRRLYIKHKQHLNKMIFLLINLLFYIAVIKTLWEYYREILIKHYIFVCITFILFVLFNIKFMVNSIQLSVKDEQIENFNRYSKIISNVIEEIRRKQHDFKNHLNTIYGIVQIGNEETLKDDITAYIKTLNSSLQDIDIFIQSENKVIKGTIYSKSCEAKTKDIQFLYNIEDKKINFPIEDYELSQILTNVIDNAFEAVEDNTHSEKNVIINIGQTKNIVYIEIKNSGNPINPQIINKIFKKGFSTKGEVGHGYGLYNVKNITEAYGGRIQLSYEDGFVIFKIIFNI